MWLIRVNTLKVEGEKTRKQEERLAIESTITLTYTDPKLASKSFITTGTDTPDLVTGYILATHHKVGKLDHGLSNLDHDYTVDLAACQTTSAPKSEHPTVTRQDIVALMFQFQENALLYKDTAITTSAAFAAPKKLLFFAEDFDQNHAIYKALGKWDQQSEVPIWIVSGRIDSALVALAVSWGCRCLVSRLGVTDRAYTQAVQSEMTLIGFARGSKMTVYNGRIQ